MSELSEILEIDSNTVKKMGNIAQHLDSIANNAERAGENFRKAFEGLPDMVSSLATNLGAIQTSLKDMGVDVAKGLKEGLKSTADEAVKASDAITKATTALAQFSEKSSARAPKIAMEGVDEGLAKYNTKELEQELQVLWAEMDKVRERIALLNQAYNTGNTEMQKMALEAIPAEVKAFDQLSAKIERQEALLKRVREQPWNTEDFRAYYDKLGNWADEEEKRAQQKAAREQKEEEARQKKIEALRAESVEAKKSSETYASQADGYARWWEQAIAKREAAEQRIIDIYHKQNEAVKQSSAQYAAESGRFSPEKQAQEYTRWWEQALKAREDKEKKASAATLKVEQDKLRALESQYLRLQKIQSSYTLKGYDKSLDGTPQAEAYSRVKALMDAISNKMQEMLSSNNQLQQSSDFLNKKEQERLNVEIQIAEAIKRETEAAAKAAETKAATARKAAEADQKQAVASVKALENEYLRLQKKRDELNLTAQIKGGYSAEEAKHLQTILTRMNTVKSEMNTIISLYDNIGHSADFELKQQAQVLAYQERKTKIMADAEARQEASAQAEAAREQRRYTQLEQQLMRLEVLKAQASAKGYNQSQNAQEVEQWTNINRLITATEEEMSAIAKRHKDIIRNEEAQIRNEERILNIKRQQTKEQERQAAIGRAKELRTPEGALSFAQSLGKDGVANSYENRAKAIRHLEEAMKNLDSADVNYKKTLDDIIKKHKELVIQQKEVEGQMKGLNTNIKRIYDLSTMLGKAFSAAFALGYIKNFVAQLVTVRGELEKQNIALASMLQSQEKADEIFKKISQQSIKSPFSIRELTTYTKQLAAYQVEYDKLFDTMKRLADISAGLGVGMDRLILAYGQVKAANYLRATEVRQFTEAGINILGQLAKYFSELEGKMVSVAEVQERVTKRMVMFEDVQEVFDRMTKSGGLFFEMQEKQAESMYGMWKNVKDRMTIMWNNIGQENEALIKGTIRTLGFLMTHYRELIHVLNAVVAGLVAYRLGIIKTAQSTHSFVGVLKGLVGALANIGKFLTTNVWALAIYAVGDALVGIWNHFKRLNDALREVNAAYDASMAKAEEMKRQFENIADDSFHFHNVKKLLGDLNEQLQELGLGLRMINEEGKTISIDINLVRPENIDNVFRTSLGIFQEIEETARNLSTSLTESMNDVEGWFHIFGDNLASDAKDLSDAYGNINKGLKKQIGEMTNYIVANKELLLSFEDIRFRGYAAYINELAAGRQEGEDELKWYQRQAKLLDLLKLAVREHRKELDEGDSKRSWFKVWSDKAVRAFNDVSLAEAEMAYEANKFFNVFVEREGGMDEVLTKAAESPENMRAAIEKALKGLDMDEISKNFIKDKLYLWIGIQPMPVKEEDFLSSLTGLQRRIWDSQDFLSQLRDDITDPVDVFNRGSIKGIKSFEDFIDIVTKRYKELDTAVKKFKEEHPNLVWDPDAQEELAEYEQQLRDIKDLADWWGISLVPTDAKKAVNDQIGLLQDLRKEYEANLKLMGKGQAKAFTLAQFKDNELFQQMKEWGVIQENQELTVKGLTEALKRLRVNIDDVKLQKKVDEVISKLQNEDILIKIKFDLEDAKRDLDVMFEKFQSSKALKDLGLLGSQIKSLGVEPMNLDQLEESVKEYRDKYSKANRGLGSEEVKMFEEVLKKIQVMREKNLQEQLKEYSKYLKMEYTETAKIRVKEAQDIANIQAMQGIDEPSREAMIAGVKRVAEKAYQQAKWKEFQATDTYIEMFNNLEYVSTATLDKMKSKLSELHGTLQELDPSDLKEIQKRFNAIEEQIMSRQTWKGAFEQVKTLKNTISGLKSEGDYQIDLINAENEIAKANEALKQISVAISEVEAGRMKAGDTLIVNEETITLTDDAINQLQQLVLHWNSIIKTQHDAAQGAKNNLDTYTQFRKALKNAADAWANIVSVVKKFRESLDKVLDAYELLDDDSIGKVWYDASFALLENVANLMMFRLQLQQATVDATILGVSLKTAMGVLGWIILAVETIASLFAAIVNTTKKDFENRMKSIRQSVEDLKDSFDKLSDSVDKAYDIASMRRFNQELTTGLETLKAQRAQLESLAASSKWRNKFKDDLDSINETIAETEQQIKETSEAIIEALGGFGTQSNLKSAAEDFVDAWHSAFMETGDGLAILSDKLDEFIDNAIKKQLLLRLSQAYIDPLMRDFDEMFKSASESGEMLTKEELENWKEKARQLIEVFDHDAKALMSDWGISPGRGDEMSGLAAGIQGVTEEEAEIVAAITESIRFFVSDTNALLHNFELVVTTPEKVANPWYEQMVSQTNYLRQIRDSIESVIFTDGLNKTLRVSMA